MDIDRISQEDVAVIGMSCRFAPDLDSPEKFWPFLANGQCAVSEMPEKRWAPYKSSGPEATSILRNTVRSGAFLDDIEGFDAEFFGISPREAEFLDPQQRFMLEMTWEALLDAGVPPMSLRETETSVFAASNSNDYGRRLLEDIPRTGPYAVNGTTFYGMANRVSYFLDLRGPSMAVDTACAGSLTALYLAAQSLRAGETSMAVVGGINIMATPALNVALDAAGAMAPDGRSKAFDKAADGYGRGEGGGVLVLKRLAEAHRDGDPILALIRGGGVFQDGRSDGMMAPSGLAQEHMLRQIYERAGVDPRTVDYVEAHGTGTPAGDREEAQALANVFGTSRAADYPLLFGSVKTNIGHTEGASGIAGVIKTILALRNEEIPPSLHSEKHPDLDDVGAGLDLVGMSTAWPRGQRPRRAGVSSYGVGGTIAHLVLEESPTCNVADQHAKTETKRSVYPISAMSNAGLRDIAGRTADWISKNPGRSLPAVGHTLSSRRSHLSHRGAVVAASADELADGLRELSEGRGTPRVMTGRAGAGQGDGVVWVFSGHGAQWSGMGRQLLDEEPAFAGVMDELGAVFREELGWTPREAIVAGGPWTACQVQAMTFAMQVGLAAVWRRMGVRPAAIIGHSVGEIAATVEAGGFDTVEAARFACRRAAALQAVDGRGAMAMASLSFDEARDRLAGLSDIEAAISAGPSSTVVSGDREALEKLAAEWREEQCDMRRVDTDIAFHSFHLDEVVDEVRTAASDLHYGSPDVRLYSTALSDPRSGATRDSDYWGRNLRHPVKFVEAVRAAIEDGHRLFVEISSHPVVTHSVMETLDHLGVDEGVAVSTLRRDCAESETIVAQLAQLHCRGAAVDWSAVHPESAVAPLPTVAWQHRPYWVFPESSEVGTGSGHDPEEHSLLGGRMTVSGSPNRVVWQTYLDMSSRPYPQDHRVVGVEITPAASIINTFVKAFPGSRPTGLTDIVLRTPLAVTPPRTVQVVLSESVLRLASRIANETGIEDGEDEWITHTTAVVDPSLSVPDERLDVSGIRARASEQWDWARVDELFRTKGVEGYAFPWELEDLHCSDSEQLSVLTLVSQSDRPASSWAHVVDAALTISAVLVTPENAKRLWMSQGIGSIVFSGEPPSRLLVHSRRSSESPDESVDVSVADGHGRLVCEVKGLRFAELQDQAGATTRSVDLVHEIVWRPLSLSAHSGKQSAPLQVVLVGEGAYVDGLVEKAAEVGVHCRTVRTPEELTTALEPEFTAVIVAPEPHQRGESLEQALERCTWSFIRSAQALAEDVGVEEQTGSARLWCLTRGVRNADHESALTHSALWGVSRVIAGEHPDIYGGVLDLADLEPATIERAFTVVNSGVAGEEEVIAVAGGNEAVARLNPVSRTSAERPSSSAAGLMQCQPNGTYLITGGLGALGFEIARFLVDKGARRVLLAGRRGLPPRTEWAHIRDTTIRRQIDGVLELEAQGVTVSVLALDITDEDDVKRSLDSVAQMLPPIRGVIHAAGATSDAIVTKTEQGGLRKALDPKVKGGLNLHRAFPPGALDFFVMFSSCGQFARLTGQASYAAANSFLDTLAAYRHRDGQRESVSLGWTSWKGTGMSADIGSTMLEANTRGLESVTPTDAFRAWSLAERFRAPYQAIMKSLPIPSTTSKPPMFREIVVDEDPGAAENDDRMFDWDCMSTEELRDRVGGDVCVQVGAELNLPSDEIELRRPLVELGVDSVMTVAIRARLQRRYGIDLPPTILWSKPTVDALAEHLVESLKIQASEPENAAAGSGVLDR